MNHAIIFISLLSSLWQLLFSLSCPVSKHTLIERKESETFKFLLFPKSVSL